MGLKKRGRLSSVPASLHWPPFSCRNNREIVLLTVSAVLPKIPLHVRYSPIFKSIQRPTFIRLPLKLYLVV